ncbi:MAG: hypothetical protein JXL97_03650 [Bacteroidales bacterium]|nr:hypothetical protein [Bacteroidales bacterium]
MEKTKIQSISKSKIVDYSEKEIRNFWLKNELNKKTSFIEEILSNYKNSISNELTKIQDSSIIKFILQNIENSFFNTFIQNNPILNSIWEDIKKNVVFNYILKDTQDSVICIQTEQIDDAKLITEIFNASKRRNRIYIFTNEEPEKLKELAGACLIRYGVKNIGSFILINPNSNNSQGILFTAPFLESSFSSSNIALELDKNQINILFRFFSYNFWNKATHEIIDNFETAKSVSEPPLDFLPNIQDFCDFDFVKQKISEQTDNLILTVPRIETNHLVDFKKIQNSKFFTNFQNNDFDLLHSIERNENEILANQNQINLRLIISDNNESWLIPKTHISNEDNIFALQLNDLQKSKLKKVIDFLFENAKYEYHFSKYRKELVNRNVRLISDLNNEITIKELDSQKAEDINSPEFVEESNFESQEPKFSDDNISCKIEFKWNINPFYLPQNAKRAKIYEEWHKVENEFQNICHQLEKSISDNENRNITEKLKRFILGKKQSFSKNIEELNKFKAIKLSDLEISKRKERITEFNNLIKNVSVNIFEIETEVKKSEIDNEIEKLIENKDTKEKELKQFIEKNEKEIEQKETNKQQKLEEFCNKYDTKISELGKFKSELQRKKDKKKQKIEEDQKILEELQEIEGFNFRNKFEEEKKRFESEIRKIEQEIERKEKEKSKIGNETDQQTSSLNFVISGKESKSKNQKLEFTVPEKLLSLPKIGELYEQGNQKFLAIEFWEDYEIGKQETERLNAKLCAKL